ncbi:uncharacterized protein [Littorina saxatilis]|uniref:Uncharacterized protein n=1 Tax=Littorina saxatilis TaxID=31220 RepID=A0AAN9G012_9CAEN
MIMMALPMIKVFLLCLSGITASRVDHGGSSKTNDSLPGGPGNPHSVTASATIIINPAIIQAINASYPGPITPALFKIVQDQLNNPQFTADMNRVLRQYENATKEEREKAALDFLKDYLKQGKMSSQSGSASGTNQGDVIMKAGDNHALNDGGASGLVTSVVVLVASLLASTVLC